MNSNTKRVKYLGNKIDMSCLREKYSNSLEGISSKLQKLIFLKFGLNINN